MSEVKSQSYSLEFKTEIQRRAYQLSLATIKLVASFPNQKIFWVIGDQLLRSITSIGANIIEAKASSSRREFIKFYEIALKSSNEAEYWWALLIDSGLVEVSKIVSLLSETRELSNMLGASLLTLKGKRKI